MSEHKSVPSWPGMKWVDLRRNIEALLFAAGEPLYVDAMLEALGLGEEAARRAVEEILEELATEFPSGGTRGFELVRLAGGWAFRTNPGSQEAVKALFELPAEAGRLSSAAMECLAIVAYLQPVTRPQIMEVRGVNSDSPIHTLLDRELIVDAGRSQSGGGAVLYATTSRFETMFGLADLTELPPLEGFALKEDAKADLRRRLGLLTVPG
jgi:segregation and condensation protein B